MDPDIQLLTDKAAEKIRGRYTAPYAINSALKTLALPAEEKEKLRREIAQELNTRSQRTKKRKGEESRMFAQRLKEALCEEQIREAAHLAFMRRDHLLSDP